MTSAESRVLECGVVGAGIAGLAAAIALSRAGHHVNVYERSQFKKEIGAAIALSPNANLVLDHWGLDAEKAAETEKRQFRSLKHDTMECLYQASYDDVGETYGHAFNAYHRVDLHNALRELAEAQISGKIKLGSAIDKIDCEAGMLKLADGTEIHNDLIVLADGIKSQFAEVIAKAKIPVIETGKSVFRTLVPMDRLMANEHLKPILTNEPSGFISCPPTESGTMMVTYPCHRDEIMNVAVFHNTTRQAQDWNSEACVQDALGVLDDYHSAWKAMVSNADSMHVYAVSFRTELSTMIRGCAVIIGDAAHPMMPTYGQGGCMAIEDAAALEILFADLAPGDPLASRLKLFNQLRLPRCVTTQILSNAMFYNGELDKGDAIRKYYRGPLLSSMARAWSEEIREFYFPYNVFQEARIAMACKDAPEGIPDGIIQHFGRRIPN